MFGSTLGAPQLLFGHTASLLPERFTLRGGLFLVGFILFAVVVTRRRGQNKLGSRALDAMAAPNKFSFSVRSILDLPEQDAEAAPRSSPVYSTCSSSSPYTTWTDCDRSPCMCECFKEILVTANACCFFPQFIIFFILF